MGKPMGRPRKEIDKIQFEKLCGLQCRIEEVCGFFDVCADTLEEWCKRTYGESFSKVFAKKRGTGKIALRRSQWRLAEKSATMAIWLGKQYLGQRDTADIGLQVSSAKEDALSTSLKELADSLDKGE